MQFLDQGKPPVGIIFDSDMGNRIDTALAMALLYGLDGKREARVISVSVSKTNLNSAALTEAIGRFYAGAVSGDFGAFGRNLPVGMSIDGKSPEDTPMLLGPLGKKNADGAPVYHHGIHKLVDTAEVPALIRNALTSQEDGNAIAVLAGPATNFARVLGLPGVKDLITRKLRYLVVSGGAFPSGEPEAHIKSDIAAAKKLFAEWPGPVFALGREVGASLPFPAESIEKDFAWSQAHPVVDAYRAYKAMPYDAPAWDMAAVLYAVRPKENYFKLSEPGTIGVDEAGRTKFTPSAEGKHRYLILDPGEKERIVRVFRELASAKPVVRQRRRRPDEQKEQKVEPPKK
jgi:inosine-uridine nucleoside N-ribohydrolase